MSPDPVNTSLPAKGGRIRVFAVAMACVLAAGYVLTHRQRAEASVALARASADAAAQAVPVSAVRVVLTSGRQNLRLPGAVAAWYESTLYGRVNGYVDHWRSDLGDRVRKGQVLASIATPDLDAELAAARARQQADQAETAVRKAARDFAATTFERWRDSPQGVVAEQEREAKKADFDSAAAQLDAAIAHVNLDRAEVERLEALSAFKQVTSPIDGVVSERRIDIGNLVTAGSTSATMPLYRVVDDSRLRVFVDVPQNLAGQVGPGTDVAVLAGADGAPIAAKVTRSAGAVDVQARTLKVEIDMANPGRRATPGQYVQVDFKTRDSALPMVPAAAILFRSSGPQVATIASNGKIHFQPVVIARDEGTQVAVSGGLAAGDLVALNLGSQVAEGDTVQAQVAGTTPAAGGAK